MKNRIFSVSEKSLFLGAMKSRFFRLPKIPLRKVAFSERHEKSDFFRFPKNRYYRASRLSDSFGL